MAAITVTVTVTDSTGATGTATASATIGASPLFVEGFNGVTAASAVTTSNTLFTSVSGSITGQQGAAFGGSKFARFVANPTLASATTPIFASSPKLLASQRLSFTALPSAAVRVGGARTGSTASAAVGLSPTGALQLFNASTGVGTLTGSNLSAGVEYLLEHFVDSVADTQTARATRVSDGAVIATITGTYTGGTLDNYRVGPYTAATVTIDVDSLTISDGADWVPSVPPPVAVTLVGASSNRPSVNNARTSTTNLEAALRAASGQSRQHLYVRHTYNGNTFPTTFAGTLAATDPADGYRASVINVKCDWAGLAAGTFDQRIRDFADSVPAGYVVYLIINHEPENDGRFGDAALWCAGQARAAKVAHDYANPRLFIAVCHMATTWFPPGSNGRETDWADPIVADPNFTASVKARTVLAPDGYCKMTNSSGTAFTTPDSRFGAVWAWADANGWTARAVSENALNNDAGAPQTACASWLSDVLAPWLVAEELVYYLYYESPGPAAGGQTPSEATAEANGWSPYLDTAGELSAYAAICLTHNQ